MTTLMPSSDEHIARLEAMSRVFARANRILSAEDVSCSVVDDHFNSAPAWSDGRHITFNASRIYNIASIEDIVQVTGFNYHELSHVLYTPRKNTKIVSEVLANGWNDAFNILEDQRIESMLTAIYPATIPYFIATFTRYCTASPEDWKANFIIMHGRRYLPIAMRNEFRRQFAHQKYVKQIEKIIDEYRKLVFPTDNDRAIALVEKFHRILLTINMVKPKDPFGHICGQRPIISVGSSAPVGEQQDTQDAVDYLDEELEERDAEDLDDDADTDTDEESDSDDSVEGTGKGSADSDEDSDDEESDTEGGAGSADDSEDDDADSDINAPSDGGVSGGDTDVSNDLPDNYEEVMKLLGAIKDKVMQSADVLADAKNKQEAITSGDGEVTISLSSRRYTEQPVAVEDNLLVDEFAYELKKLRTDADPYWESRNSSGRVNIDRAMRGDDFNEIFDSFREGQIDSTEVEAVILLDISSSMAYRMAEASKAMWVIKSALESINANVTVLAFNDSTHLLYDKDDLADTSKFRVFGSENNTQPNNAIRQALKVFDATQRGNKICFFVTDGEWDGDYGVEGNDELIQSMNNAGVLTALAYLDYPHYSQNLNDEAEDLPESKRHNCQFAKRIYDTRQLVDLARVIANLSFTEH